MPEQARGSAVRALTQSTAYRMGRVGGLHVLAGFIVLAVVVPHLATGTYLFTWATAMIWAVFALSTNVLFGWSGLLSFGQTAFFGLGAYTLAVVHEKAPGVDALVLLVIAAAVAAIIGAVFALMALRSSGAEFAVLTLVLAQVFWLLTYRVAGLHGDDGFAGLTDIKVGGTTLLSDLDIWYYIVMIAMVCAWLLWLLHGSTLGTAMRAVRDDAHRAAALGIRVRRVQVLAFAIGAAGSAVAGGLLAQQQGVVSPSVLSLTISGEVLVACLVGGLRIFGGPIVGAVVLILAEQALSGVTTDSTVFVGVFLLIIVLALPSGLTSLPARWRAAWTGRRHGSRSPAASPPATPGSIAGSPRVQVERESVS
ncbi:amino acid/amide ABC transporter membrane protein 2 (HAAT family) [Jatrophihabitans sp. GAS493]|uniref:branched-chain amino acid ABC transporter permease n=1 Tax=Jatrophihabitans sp. GAS493 TaxID=1907575 RepID=UPI000BB73731|nr:branched-chain amino acid ABC transporter permease [Jatrophihabitans sp. GAS493]SOD74667.1 amino acid/amide ABC transporter membrane protein 2 (HAAT family) [Jatrophihabitans sp. GAS493]